MIAPRYKPVLQPARSADFIRSDVWSALWYEVVLRALDLDRISGAVQARVVMIEGYVASRRGNPSD